MLIKASILVQLNQCHSYPKSVCRLKSKKEEWQDISFKVLSVSFQSLVFQNSFVFGKYHEEASKSQHIVQKPSLCQLSMCLSSVPTSPISSPHRGHWHCKICDFTVIWDLWCKNLKCKIFTIFYFWKGLCVSCQCVSSVPTSRISSPHRGHCKICASSLLPLSNTVLLFWFCMNDIWWLPMNGC